MLYNNKTRSSAPVRFCLGQFEWFLCPFGVSLEAGSAAEYSALMQLSRFKSLLDQLQSDGCSDVPQLRPVLENML
jgi:hypothetical protein